MEQAIRQAVTERLPDVSEKIEAGEQVSPDDRKAILRVAREAK